MRAPDVRLNKKGVKTMARRNWNSWWDTRARRPSFFLYIRSLEKTSETQCQQRMCRTGAHVADEWRARSATAGPSAAGAKGSKTKKMKRASAGHVLPPPQHFGIKGFAFRFVIRHCYAKNTHWEMHCVTFFIKRFNLKRASCSISFYSEIFKKTSLNA